MLESSTDATSAPMMLLVVGAIVVVLTAALVGVLLRWARCPGGSLAAALLGGMIVGVAVGPGVLGRMAPAEYARWIGGGASALEELAISRREAGAHAAAVQASGAALESEGADRLERAALAFRAAADRDRRGSAVLVAILAAAIFAAQSTRISRGRATPALVREGISLGAWSALIPMGLACVAWSWFDSEISVAPLLLIAASLGVGAWHFSMGHFASSATSQADPNAPRDATVEEVPVVNIVAACAATLLAALIAGVGLVLSAASWWTLPLVGVPLAIVAPIRSVRPMVAALCVPGVVALTMSRIEIWQSCAIAPILAAYLIAEDGRWFGAWLAHWTTGRARPLRAMRLGLAGLGVGPPMAAIAAIGFGAGVLDSFATVAILLAATVLELIATLRLRVDAQLREAEEFASEDE